MSTLKIFLCVAALCITQTIAGTDKGLNKNAVISRIDQAIKTIDGRATQVYRRVAELGPQDSEKLFNRYVPKPRGEAWNLTTTVKNLVERFITASALSDEKKAECKAHYDTWQEKFVDNVPGIIDGAPYNTHYYADLAFGKLLHEASQNKIVLTNLKDRVNVGDATAWNEIIRNVENITTTFLSDAEKIQKYYESMVDGTGILAMLKSRTNWDENFNSGMEILEKVFNCTKPRVFMFKSDSKALPHIFHYDYDRMVKEQVNAAEIDLA